MYNYKTINKLASEKDLTILGSDLQRYCPNATLSTDIIVDDYHLFTIKRLVFNDCTVELEYESWTVKSIDIIKS